jgi:hypothetical protein
MHCRRARNIYWRMAGKPGILIILKCVFKMGWEGVDRINLAYDRRKEVAS